MIPAAVILIIVPCVALLYCINSIGQNAVLRILSERCNITQHFRKAEQVVQGAPRLAGGTAYHWATEKFIVNGSLLIVGKTHY